MRNEPNEMSVLLGNRMNLSDDLLSVVSLAKRLNVTLKGVFLEDENLLRASDLSISSDISFWSAKEKTIDRDSLQQSLRNHAAYLKQELRKIAKKEDIKFGFDVVRGQQKSWINEEIKINRILFVAHQKRYRNNHYDLNYRYLNRNVLSKEPIKVVFTDSKASMKALEIAIQIGLESGRSVEVLLDAETFENEFKQRECINVYLERYRNSNVNIELTRLKEHENALYQNLYMLVYPIELKTAEGLKQLPTMLKLLNSPLMLVR